MNDRVTNSKAKQGVYWQAFGYLFMHKLNDFTQLNWFMDHKLLLCNYWSRGRFYCVLNPMTVLTSQISTKALLGISQLTSVEDKHGMERYHLARFYQCYIVHIVENRHPCLL